MFTVEDMSLSTGNRFFVDSGSAGVGSTASYGRSPDAPLASLALSYSLDVLTSNNGDIVYLMPGHVENVAAAAGIACDIPGVRVVGLGEGSSKPTITFITDTASTMTVTAASTTLENIRFVGDIDALVVGIPVTAAYCSMINCEFIDNGTDNTVDWITLSAAADDYLCLDCLNKGTATAGNDSFISMAAASDVKIINLRSNGDFAAANIECTAAPVNLLIEGARLENANAVDVCIEGFAAATGMCVDCLVRIATDAQTTGINTAGALALFACYQVNNDGESGLLIGAPSV
jgi:hypothetical protein